MVLLVVLLFCSCLGCLREGVWTTYTPADVARWHAHAADETAVPRHPLPPQPLAAPRLARGFSGPAENAALRREAAATPAKEFSAWLA
ncbi:hypothetical protein [Hymenobacter sp. IS2118]|uniref:hypothetical protein n=1 Tax=Hymenobacter sp. IS2118 TaxID=1505605 RepID=UPI00054E13FE|nr:hypothetical protein [Hymenobacter sp. IS2118]